MRIPNGTGQGAVSAASGTSQASPSRSASVSVSTSTPNSTSVVTTISSSSSSSSVGTTNIGAGIGVVSEKPVRDSSWLELEVCRDFQRLVCPRSAEECRFAHPESGVVKDGKVTCCYDFLKDRCRRERCKYFHPPGHIKQRLITAGKQFGAMMSGCSGMYIVPGGTCTAPMPTPTVPASIPVLGNDRQVFATPAPPAFLPVAMLTPYGTMTDRLYICPEFLSGQCTVQMCPFVHPEPYVRWNLDSTVTVCRDFTRGGCQRLQCRYYHPPPLIATQLEMMASQQAMFVAPTVMPSFSPMMYPPVPPSHTPIAHLPLPSLSPTTIPTSGMSIFPMPAPIPLSYGVPISHPSPVHVSMVSMLSIPPVTSIPPQTKSPSFSPPASTAVLVNGINCASE